MKFSRESPQSLLWISLPARLSIQGKTEMFYIRDTGSIGILVAHGLLEPLGDLKRTPSAVRGVVARAGGTESSRLIQILKVGQPNVFDWVEPRCYGDEPARAIYLAGFAIWILRVMPGSHNRPVIFERGNWPA
jgi:hypothetical protein